MEMSGRAVPIIVSSAVTADTLGGATRSINSTYAAHGGNANI